MEIVLATHGDLGEGLFESYKMIAGEAENIHTIKLTDSGVGEFKEKLHNTLNTLTASGEVLVLVDLKGGTPYNESFMYSLENPGKIEVVSGVNLPMLIEIGYLSGSESDASNLADTAVSIGKESIEKLEA